MWTPRASANAAVRTTPNVFDLMAILIMLGAAITIAGVARHTLAPLSAPGAAEIHLDPAFLPGYAVRTTARMFAALGLSLLFTFTYAVLAAKSRRAGLILVPVLDILQSIPIFGFLTFTVVFFMGLFPGRVLGAELAAIFTIFTSQAWNMAFSMYQSLTTVPRELDEASRCFGLSAWQKFWRLEVPFAIPGLVWNTMMSMSGGWFMVVASEAISVGDVHVVLPGIGSYVGAAIAAQDIHAVFYAIVAMLVVIIAYDQLIFRPVVAWSARFRYEMTQGAVAQDPWMLTLLRRTRLLAAGGRIFGSMVSAFAGLRIGPRAGFDRKPLLPPQAMNVIWAASLVTLVGFAAWQIAMYVHHSVSWHEVGRAVLYGFYTMLRVIAMIALATLIWVPVGVWLGLRPAWARRAQPVAQFLAAFPANLFFPLFVVVIVAFHLNPDIWLTPLMVLGTQWYILFNVVAGAAAFPGELLEASRNFNVRGWLWWRSVILPGIAPYYITGAITASGGAWNASLLAEVASWGHTTLHAHGIGAYITDATTAGETARVALGMVVMTLFVLSFNRIVWRPMYAYAARRLTFA
ncbi:NitT/TauT family transport system permease protein [Endobacter medicaginis]|uniref:ABC transporter permease subunit n=1 Tax=Endobacter medicaginis TaxID=1181271 RepID=A0A839V5P9_9PROT|nr:ABC transporter permease subunit [Endobacter medicaginis]MBB3174859.1 NitT/TauT family transport system permease protein [Endobacter medicaginis]MCX5475609.1 ABC transporter permease subunit [Endobacter medicaginis]NVN30437.1 ABC transporter permease subunit [Endobacter medicaginis]